jgi:hypothetical protein
VFYQAYAFNGDVNQWDVANVNTMYQSKSIRILENDLAWRELMLLWSYYDDISCFCAVMRFPFEISCFSFHILSFMQRHAWERVREKGGDGVCWEGASCVVLWSFWDFLLKFRAFFGRCEISLWDHMLCNCRM